MYILLLVLRPRKANTQANSTKAALNLPQPQTLLRAVRRIEHKVLNQVTAPPELAWQLRRLEQVRDIVEVLVGTIHRPLHVLVAKKLDSFTWSANAGPEWLSSVHSLPADI